MKNEINKASIFETLEEKDFYLVKGATDYSNTLDKISKSWKNIGEALSKISNGEMVMFRNRYAIDFISRYFADKSQLISIKCISVSKFMDHYREHSSWLVGLNEFNNEYMVLASLLEEDAGLIEEISKNTANFYNKFTIPKRDGSRRTINAPCPDLKRIQKKILHKILYGARASTCSHGFMNGKGIKTNALQHVGKEVVVKMDLSHFFDTINKDMVRAAFAEHLDKRDCFIKCFNLISDLCTLNGFTPQGAPTSPTLSNIVFKNIDFSLKGLATQRCSTYTRYADDLTFSSDDKKLPSIIPIVTSIVNKHGFRINTKKTGVFRKGGRQPVTGITVNQIPSVPRDKRMKFRAKLHNIKTGKIPQEEVNFAEIDGYANFINMVNPEQGSKFLAKIKEIKEMFNRR